MSGVAPQNGHLDGHCVCSASGQRLTRRDVVCSLKPTIDLRMRRAGFTLGRQFRARLIQDKGDMSMKMLKNIDVQFVAGFGPVVRDPAASRKFYSEALGLSFKEETNGYLHTDGLDGVKHFALWPLAQAAESCFGTDQWPGNLPVPQGWIEFDVVDIKKATAELKSQGYKLLVATQKEPWGQIVTRLLGPEGLLVGITHTPSMRK
jgi:catechol 2,3-dioxygenase-like lactoylglutathione lyase family enzyme